MRKRETPRMGLLSNFGTSLTLLLAHLSLLRAHREHKVHNIVLYPDKESWCKTEPIKQVVTWPQCAPKELDNNVCVGACFSYMVPHSEPSAPGDLIRPYCDSCQPLDSVWHTVTLDCKDKDENPTTMQKKVQIITNCSCSSCAESSRIKPDLNSLLASLAVPPAPTFQTPPAAAHQEQQQQQQSLEQFNQAVAPTIPPPPVQPTVAPTAPGSSASSSEPIEQASSSSLAPPIVYELLNETSAEAPTSFTNSNETDSREPESTVVANSEPSTSSSSSSAPSIEQPVVEATAEAATGPQSHETPDLLLNPNLNASRVHHQGEGGSSGPGAHERFLQLFKQINDPALGADKLAKLQSLQKLEKLEKLASEYSGAEELLNKLSELLRRYSNQEEQQQQQQTSDQLEPSLQPHHHELNRPTNVDEVNDNEEVAAAVNTEDDDQDADNEPADDVENNEERLQQQHHHHHEVQQSIETDPRDSLTPEDELQAQLGGSESTSTSTTLTPPPELPAIAPKDPDDEEVPSLQEGQLRVAAMMHRTGPHHSLVLDADDAVKEKIDVESHYLHPALAGQEISYHDNVLIDKSKKSEKDF